VDQAESFQLPKRRSKWNCRRAPPELGKETGSLRHRPVPGGKAQKDKFHVGLIYSHDPWNVITLGVKLARPRHFENVHRSPGMQWITARFGGGTPPVPYDDSTLVTFFHSAQIIGSRNVYSVGACIFLAQAPYAPVLMTADPLLMAPYRSGLSAWLALLGQRGVPAWRRADGRGLSPAVRPRRRRNRAFPVRHDELAARLAAPCHGPTGAVHDYRGGKGARLPLKRLLYVPDPIPAIPNCR